MSKRSLKLKICGMRDAANIAAVAALKPDFMGFIFYDRSPRFVGKDFKLPVLPDAIVKVGVFVNAGVDEILSRVSVYGLDAAQLHGDESIEVCRELKSHGLQVIKAFRINNESDLSQLDGYAPNVDWFLFDAAGANYGGNAKVFDWSILNGYRLNAPFFLSGGLSPDNVAAAARLGVTGLSALDLNSGVESAPAVKSIAQIMRVQQELEKKNL